MKWIRKKRSICFKKKKIWKDNETYLTISDAALVEKILEIAESFNCELIDIKLNTYYWSDNCKITIKSEKEEFLKFTKEFVKNFKENLKEIDFTI